MQIAERGRSGGEDSPRRRSYLPYPRLPTARREQHILLLISGSITSYLLDIQPGLHVVLSETQGAAVTRHVHSLRGIHAHKDTANNWEWPLQDGLGSVREVVDNSVAVLESRSYDPFGIGFGNTGTNQTGYGFTGELVDGGNLLDLRARRYEPGLGVFASLDPLETPNRYAYVNGNPINYTDPNGLSPEEDFWGKVRDAIVDNLPWELGNSSYNRPSGGPYNVQLGPNQIRRLVQSASCPLQDQRRQAFDQLISRPRRELGGMLANTAENIHRTSYWGRIWLGIDATPVGVNRVQAGFEAFLGFGDVVTGGGFNNLRSGNPVQMLVGAIQIFGLINAIGQGYQLYSNFRTNLTDLFADPSYGGFANKGTSPIRVPREQALRELLDEAARIGVNIDSSTETVRYLNYKGVNAIAIGDYDILILPEYSENVRVLREEIIHIYQSRLGLVSTSNTVELEIQARELLVRGRHIWAITDDEVSEIIKEIRKMRETGRY